MTTTISHSTDTLFRLNDYSRSTPVILHAPHGGRTVPVEYQHDFLISLAEIEEEKNVMTDHFTDALVDGTNGASSVINDLSRLVVDIERFPDETEEMNAVGMGVLYTHGSRRQEIRRVSADSEKNLLNYFAAYSARFTQLVDATLEVHGRVTIIDVHSYRERELPYELHDDGYRAPLCVGSDPFHASEVLLGMVAESFPELESCANKPFAGAYVPLKHYHRDARVSSVMLEIRRDVYMDEAAVTLNPERFLSLQKSLQLLIDRSSNPT